MRVWAPRRDQEGAVAVLMAALVVLLFVASAFVVDLGQSYVSKRQLQTAADSAVLAAGSVYANYQGTCNTLAMNSVYKAEAQAAADAMRSQNRPGSTGSSLTANCNAQGELELTYSAEGTTDAVFGQLVTGTSRIGTYREASATVDVPSSVSNGIRPYALCNADVPLAGSTTGVVEITPPGQAHSGSSCADAQAGGNWWFVTCDIPSGGQSDGSPHNMGEAIEEGCTNTISVVSPQDATSPTTLSASMTLNCKTGSSPSPSCLDGDTGNSSLSNKFAYEAWDTILGDKILLPVFCSTPTCSPDTVNGTGTNSRYPVFAIASVVVCGYHIYNKNSKVSNTGDCAGNTFTSAYVSGKDKKDVYLYLKFVTVQTSGSTASASCSLGSSCDNGLRRVHLSK